MRKSDSVRLFHMLEAAQEAVSFAENKTRADLNGDRKLILAYLTTIIRQDLCIIHRTTRICALCGFLFFGSLGRRLFNDRFSLPGGLSRKFRRVVIREYRGDDHEAKVGLEGIRDKLIREGQNRTYDGY